MPFPKVPRGVALSFEHARHRNFLRREMTGVSVKHAKTIVMPTGQDRATGRGTHRVSRIEMGQRHPTLRQRVEMRGLNDRVAVEAGVPVAEIIGHDQDNVGTFGGGGARQG